MTATNAIRSALLAAALAAPAAPGPPAGCQKKTEAPREPSASTATVPAPPVRTQDFDSWDAFLASDTHDNARPHPVVFIGIDGATWDYMEGLLAKGALPNVARIRREGAYATLRSVQSYVSPPAWTSMLTGYRPEKSGVYTFGMLDPTTHEFNSVHSSDVLVPFVWEAASAAGLKTAVVNVPMTYPVYPVNGIMVSGLLTPIDEGGSVSLHPSARRDLGPRVREAKEEAAAKLRDYSEPAVSVVEDDHNVFVMSLHDTRDDRRQNYDTVSITGYTKKADGSPGTKTGTWVFPMGQYSPWVPVSVIHEDKLRAGYMRMKLSLEGGEADLDFSDTLFPIDVTYTYPDTLARTLTARFGFYLPTKMVAKEIVPANTRDTRGYADYFYDYDDWDDFYFVFTQSDNIHHKDGFSAISDSVYAEIDRCLGDMMARMPSDAVLVVASDHGFQSYDYAIDLNRYLSELHLLEYDGRGVDFEHSVVVHNLWYLYFNRALITRAELARRGIEVPAAADPVEFLEQYLADAFKRIESGGRKFPVEVEPMPKDVRGAPPDMRVTGSYGDYGVTFWNVMKPHDSVVWIPEGPDKFWHKRAGIVMVWGDGVKKGQDGGTLEIEDVAPTIAWLLGVPVGDDVDGRVMTELFEPDVVAGRPLFVSKGYGEARRPDSEKVAGREELERKLRSLGYIQ